MDIRFFFFFKQKTAYELRISDCSLDVCSSDLSLLPSRRGNPPPDAPHCRPSAPASPPCPPLPAPPAAAPAAPALASRSEERRAGKECASPCRSRWSP